MHYIIGTQIAFSKMRPRPGMTMESVKSTKPSEFEYGKIYTLYNISKKDDQYTYVFRDSHRKLVEKDFDSLSAGDQWIAKCKNESLPNYGEFYSRNTS